MYALSGNETSASRTGNLQNEYQQAYSLNRRLGGVHSRPELSDKYINSFSYLEFKVFGPAYFQLL